MSYDSTYRLVLGGALFLDHPNHELELQFDGNYRTNREASILYNRQVGEANILKSYFEVSNFFDPYFGEGVITHASEKYEIDQKRWLARVGIDHTLKTFKDRSHWGLEGGLEYHQRHEDGKRKFFPNERALVLGGNLHYDAYERSDPTASGQIYQLAINYHSKRLTNLVQDHGYLQAILDLKCFYPTEIFSQQMIFASHYNFSHTLGTPSYLFKYRLGGVEGLRGYEENRFRGKNVTYAQFEPRFVLFKSRFQGVLFYEFGSASETSFSHWKEDFGLGLRYDLPPHDIAKVRLDIGFGEDQMNLVIDFNEPF